MKQALLCYAAGAVGAVANSLVLWWAGEAGLTRELGVAIAPALSPAWLYPRLVWGGLWGLLFLLPLWNSRIFAKGIVLSLVPTLVQLLVVFPLKAGKGFFGLELGTLTPLVVLVVNIVWGIVTALTLRLAK